MRKRKREFVQIRSLKSCRDEYTTAQPRLTEHQLTAHIDHPKMDPYPDVLIILIIRSSALSQLWIIEVAP